MISALIVHLSLVLVVTRSQSPECVESKTPSQLVAVTVWSRERNGSTSFRISDEDLTDEDYQRGSKDRQDIVVLLARSPGSCTLGPCTLQLSTNSRESDGAIAHQENVFGIPFGFKDLDDSFYCARRFGDCGAQLPVLRFTRGSGPSMTYAYSLDPTASFPGYTREGKILCYGWSDSGSVVHPILPDSNGCLHLNSIANGKITYSTVKSTIYPIGTTATLACDDGYMGGGQSAVLCVRSGWYPASGLGYCVRQNAPAVSSASLVCAALGPVLNGQLLYSGIPVGGRFAQGTRATVLCNLGYEPFGSVDSICEGVNPGNSVGTCPALATPLSGTVTYNPPGTFGSYPSGTTASLSCNLGYTVSGSSTSTCSNGAWIPAVLGYCIQGLGGLGTNSILECSNPVVINGMVTYSQGNAFDPDKPSGTIATLACNPGFSPSGSTTATCQSGSWIPTLGMCISSGGLFPGTTTSGQTCTALFPPIGGSITYSTGSIMGPFNSGTVATLQCTSGFPQGASSSSCTNGQWSPPTLGTCSFGTGCRNVILLDWAISLGGSSGLTCSGLLTPISGTLIFSAAAPPYPTGTTVTLQCSAGSTPSGLTCSAMATPFGATLSYSNGSLFGPFNSGTTVTMTCPSGTPSGSTMATCTNGQWYPSTLGTCSSSIIGGGVVGNNGQCPTLTPPPGGTITMSSGLPGSPATQGTIATLTCSMGSVQGLTCPSVQQIGGTVDYSDGSFSTAHPSGTTATLICTNGVPLGSALSTCLNGQWVPPIGTCSTTGINSGNQCTMAPIAPIGATLSYSSGGLFGPWNNGATATMTCPFGQTVIGSATASCNNGVWSTLGTCSSSSGNGTFGVTLMPHGNSSLPCYFGVLEPPYGNVSYTYNAPPYPSGTIATLRCDAGYAVMGASTSTCAGVIPGGTTSQCSIGVSPVANGLINYSNDKPFGPWPVGSTATLTCNSGFFPSGVTISTCSGNGQFLPAVLGPCTSTSPNVPTPGLTCPALLAVGGTISYSSPGPPYADGSTATLFCDLGYKLSGLPTVVCKTGAWTPFPGLGSCLLSTLQKRPIDALIVQHDLNEENGNFCPAPVASPFGEVTFSKTSNSSGFPPGTTAALRCTMGRYIVGPSFATCSHGAFRPILGKCADGREDAHPGVCLPLRPPANGRITYIQSGKLDNFEVGTTALLYCLESFAVTGQATVVCSKDGWQPSSGLGECESTTRKL
ncbi:hypothetical protein RB195_006988 [Necator americanus]|uniref:Sushi domain-containing protein n=1 Tax=Necator americanus TaxID=51031 RepID=A0ABR1BWH8_NECAM